MEWLLSCLMTLFSGLLLYIIKDLLNDNKRLREERKAENIERESGLKEGMVCLLRICLIDAHMKYMTAGEISTHGYENFDAMYNAYHKLGGNGLVTHMYDDIQELRFKGSKGV